MYLSRLADFQKYNATVAYLTAGGTEGSSASKARTVGTSYSGLIILFYGQFRDLVKRQTTNIAPTFDSTASNSARGLLTICDQDQKLLLRRLVLPSRRPRPSCLCRAVLARRARRSLYASGIGHAVIVSTLR